MDDDRSANLDDGGGIKVEGAIEVFPGRHVRARVDYLRRFKVSHVWRRSWYHRKLGK